MLLLRFSAFVINDDYASVRAIIVIVTVDIIVSVSLSLVSML